MSAIDEYPYVLFYDHVVTDSNPVELACLSHWYGAPFTDPRYPGVTFATAEHYMMYCKALIFDPERAADIVSSPDPAHAKAVGRALRDFERARWGRAADDAVERGNYLKFQQHDALWPALRATCGKTLVEASDTDRVWGIGFAVDAARGREAAWGENRMGRALTRARDRLLAERGGCS